MIKIPSDDKKISVPNNSDLFGNIWYTKNINLDEEGYIKLSSRSIQIKSEEDDGNFDLLTGVGMFDTGSGLLTTVDEPYIISLSGTSTLSVTEDIGANNPNLNFDSTGIWFNGLWHASFSTNVATRPSSGTTWTATVLPTSLTSGLKHPMCNFVSRKTLLVGNGNVLRQYTTGYVADSFLTIPIEYEIIAIAYNNLRAGIITRLSSAYRGQNVDAFFFVWDGTTTEANEGVPIGSDAGISLVAYKSTWRITTRTGQILEYRSGGFEPIADFPNYYTGNLFGDALNIIVYGDGGCVDGDVVYFNLPCRIDNPNLKPNHLQNMPAGIWCLDNKVGAYHRYSPSISKASIHTITFVDTATDILTGGSVQTGDLMKYTASTSVVIGGLEVNEYYYAIRINSTTFKLSTTYELALAGTAINLTSFTAGSQYFLNVNLVDYGATITGDRNGGVYNMGGKGSVYDHLVYGGDFITHNSTSSEYAMLNVTVSDLESRGFFVTSKLASLSVTDINQKLYIKYKPLKSRDSIVLKYKPKEIVGLPYVSSFRNSTYLASWTSSTVFATIGLSKVKTQFDAGVSLECELVSGYGAGINVQISNITEASGTYTVTLSASILQAIVGYYSYFIIDNWKVLGTVTSTSGNNNEWQEFAIGDKNKSIKVKCELIGTDVTVEELQIINATYKPSV